MQYFCYWRLNTNTNKWTSGRHERKFKGNNSLKGYASPCIYTCICKRYDSSTRGHRYNLQQIACILHRQHCRLDNSRTDRAPGTCIDIWETSWTPLLIPKRSWLDGPQICENFPPPIFRKEKQGQSFESFIFLLQNENLQAKKQLTTKVSSLEGVASRSDVFHTAV